MDLTPGSYALGEDATLNMFAALVKRAGSRVVVDSKDLAFTSDDTFVYSIDQTRHILLYIPAPTDEEIDAALTCIGIDPATATDEERNLTKKLLKLKGGA